MSSVKTTGEEAGMNRKNRKKSKSRKLKNRWRFCLIAALFAVFLVIGCGLTACTQETTESANNAANAGSSGNAENAESDGNDLRAGTHSDTLPTPDDFPAEYDYGSGTMDDWSEDLMTKKTPEPENADDTVLNAVVKPDTFQVLYLWEEGNMPSETRFTEDMTGYYDDYDFRPYVTAIPVRSGVRPKGAVVLMAGGAYQIRGNYTDTLPTAAQLRELGFLTFIVDYRLQPYNQQEGALDVARAVRFIRSNADTYGIDPDDIAVMGYSAGGIQAGQFLMGYDEDVNGTILDSSYQPDELDQVPAHASAAGMIYSFYGRLSHGTLDEEALSQASLPPTFYVYGTEDPFYSQFEDQYSLLKSMGVATGRIVLDNWPHGFGGDGGWVGDYAAWLEEIFDS
jgi:acetyl esterase/lipase